MRPIVLLAALLLGAACAELVACGGGDGNIPSSDASSLERALDTVASATRAGNCAAAEEAVTKANGVLVNLPASVNARLRARLQQGITHLGQRVQVQCQGQAPATSQPQQQAQPQTSTQQQTDTTQSQTGQTSTGQSTATQPPATTGTDTNPPATDGATGSGTTTGANSGDGVTGGTPPGPGSG